MKKIILFTTLIFYITTVSQVYSENISRTSIELFKAGVVHFNKTEYEASIDFFRKAIKEDPKNYKAHYFLGMAYYKSGFEENALIEFNYLINNGVADEITKNLAEFISRKSFFFQNKDSSTDFSRGIKIEEGEIGKYVVSKATGISVDRDENIYIATFGSKIALKISPNGKPLFNFTSPKISPGRLYDIVVSEDDRVYISDFTNDKIYIFTTTGKYIGSFGKSGYKNGEFYGPTSIAIDKNGYIYVIDSGNVRIEKFSKDGKFILTFGAQGDEDGLFYRPSGIAVDKNGNIYVSDHKKKKIFIYDRNGNYITRIRGIEFTDPYGIYITENNILLVADANRIIHYDLVHSSYSIIKDPVDAKRLMDVTADYLGQIYYCSFENLILAQLVPKPDKYRSLNVILDRVDTSSYPAISYTISVFDADGIPIYGLEKDNFRLKIGGGRVPKIDLSYNDLRNSRNEILFLVEKSSSMEEFSLDLEHIVYNLVSSVSQEDKMMVIGYNNLSWVSSSFTNSKLRTLDAINEKKYDTGNRFDIAFRRAVDYLNKEFYKKSIVFITDGEFDQNSFSTYSFESCVSYATNNYIPVYVLNFTDKNEKILRNLARITGGSYYNVYQSQDLPFLYAKINDYTTPDYFIFFEDSYDPNLKNLFLEAEAVVDIIGRTGRGKLGFIYP